MDNRDVKGPTLERAQRFGIPDRWLNCPKVGELVFSKFLPFKTPLCALYDEQIPEKRKRFHVDEVIGHANLQGKQIGLWIDLTKTDRYYGEEEVKSRKIQYFKMRLAGHGGAPTKEETDRFLRAVSTFFNDHPDKIVAIHCTHGFNRTGFLIAAYFVEKMDFEASAAIGLFAAARQPGIYKQDYIDEFVQRYGDPEEDAMEAPDRPTWELGDDTALIEEGPSATSANGEDPSTSYQGGDNEQESDGRKPKKQFMDGRVSFAEWLSDESKKRMLRGKIKDLCKAKKNDFPGAQPVSLDRQNIQMLHAEEYRVSWKADGMRYMIYIMKENEIYAFDRDNEIFKLLGIHFPHPKEARHIENTLIDSECIIDVQNGTERPRLLIYDIIHFEAFNLAKEPFTVRSECIKKEIIFPRDQAIMKGRLPPQPCSVRLKEFWELRSTPTLFKEKFTKNLGHEVDGIIFQPVNRPYKSGRDDTILKWKPPSHNSIDFKLQIKKFQPPGCLMERHGYLYVLGSPDPMGEIEVTKELLKYDGKIIECRLNDHKQWELMRERTDKSHPNARSTAEAVYQTMLHPITQHDLCDFVLKYGFRGDKEGHAKSQQQQHEMKRPHEPTGGRNGEGDVRPPPSQRPRVEETY